MMRVLVRDAKSSAGGDNGMGRVIEELDSCELVLIPNCDVS